MGTVAIVASGIVLLIILLVALRAFTRRLREKGRAAIEARYPTADVLRSETLALSFGQQSKGVMQARGNGALALTRDELCFMMYVPECELRIALASIRGTSLVRSHLGKSQGVDLLHVRFDCEGADDAIAWRVPDALGWKTQIDSLR